MPIYEYRCDKCGQFEKIQKVNAEPLYVCPTCGAAAERIISKSVGVVFKGSGFYTTDNKKVKDLARSRNKERQKDNQALLDGDVAGYVNQSEATDKKVSEAK
ncbi:MAG: FmdB family zinc ribbon protein [Syntrophomonadaceae bacterium]